MAILLVTSWIFWTKDTVIKHEDLSDPYYPNLHQLKTIVANTPSSIGQFGLFGGLVRKNLTR